MPTKIVNGQTVEMTTEEYENFDLVRQAGHQRCLSTEYQHKRREAYPPIGDQLDALYKHLLPKYSELGIELQAILDTWQQVKEDFPKI